MHTHWKILQHFPILVFQNALESVNREMWEGETGVRERTFNFAEQLFPFLCDFNSLFNAFSICTMEAVNWEKGEGAQRTREGGKKGLFNFFADSLSSLWDAPNILLRKSNLWCKIWTQKYKFFMICGQHIILWKPRRPKCTIGLDRKVRAVRMRKWIKGRCVYCPALIIGEWEQIGPMPPDYPPPRPRSWIGRPPIIMCIFRLLAKGKVNSHWLHLCLWEQIAPLLPPQNI